MKLSDRLRGGVEVAPWVINAVRELEQPQWISVKDALPEPEKGDGWGRKVLVHYDSGAIHVDSMFLYQGTRQHTSVRYFSGERDTGVTARVTHWMELPAPPPATEDKIPAHMMRWEEEMP